MTKDPLRYFRVEAREIADALGRDAAGIGADTPSALIQRMMRLTHTLKGAAAVVKQRGIAEEAHALEDVLAPMRDGGAAPDALVTAVARHVDAIVAAVAALDAPAPAAASAKTLDDGLGMLRADAREIDALLDGIAEARVRLRGLDRVAARVEEARQLAELIADWAVRLPPGAERDGAARMRQCAEDLRACVADAEQGLRSGIDRNERELDAAYTAAERLRLLPCSAAFAAFAQAVDETARALGKQAALTVRGGDVRLDPQVLALVQRAVVQLLRNAVAHGIEPPAARRAAGKPETGAIGVEVARRGNRIVIACSDDGAGIDLVAVRRAAEARGVPLGDGGERALIAALLGGGLSTSRAVTEVSGRGVGLDVVREAAARLGAALHVETRAGEGTRIELAAPVALASLDALVVDAGGVTCALPLEVVRRALRLGEADVVRTPDGMRVAEDGASLALLPLARALRGSVPRDAAGPALIVAAGGASAAFRVDAIAGAANLLVRPVPALAFADPVVAGLWLDAEGVARPVIDPEALLRAAQAMAPAPEAAAAAEPAPILVIDDSLTTRVLEQSILESAGFRVDCATSAEEGLEKARARRYGLFLVDVEMPGMDGFGFVATTRADPDLGDVPAILVSSRAAPEDIEQGRRAGAHAYFIKSEFDQRRVLDTIRALMEVP